MRKTERERERKKERERERKRDGREEKRTLLTSDAFLPVHTHMMRLAIACVGWRDPAGQMG